MTRLHPSQSSVWREKIPCTKLMMPIDQGAWHAMSGDPNDYDKFFYLYQTQQTRGMN
jgi:hypothetical protein